MSGETVIAQISGRGAVTLFRISGPAVFDFLTQVVVSGTSCMAHPRQAVLSSFVDFRTKEPFDEGLVTYFKAPRSYTGEDVVELSLHGSVALSKRLFEVVTALGIRPAEPGEFTKRAYLNGKIDLTQAEAVADIIASETVEQARVARGQLMGQLAGAVHRVGEPLREMLAEIEARIDFPEEGIEPAVVYSWLEATNITLAEVQRYRETYSTGRVLHDGADVAIIGLPNAGKSSLLNCLVGEDRAIVTDIPGTTRDEIAERISVHGVPVRLWDTAGIVQTDERQLDPVEQLGIERSRKRLKSCDLILLVFDAERGFSPSQRILEETRAADRPFLVVANKLDLLSEKARENVTEELSRVEIPQGIFLSAQTGLGVPLLLETIGAQLIPKRDTTPGAVLITSSRHALSLDEAHQALSRVRSALESPEGFLDLVATDIRAALGSLSDIVGVTCNEEILGRIFSKFCIGK